MLVESVIFAGPNLDNKDLPPNALLLPPAKTKDLFFALNLKPKKILIIDTCLYSGGPSIKECLYALSRGVNLYGAAGAGALLAAELTRHGMIGLGKVYEYLQEKLPFVSLDEVICQYDLSTNKKLSLSLIDWMDSLKDSEEGDKLLTKLKNTPFYNRNSSHIRELGFIKQRELQKNDAEASINQFFKLPYKELPIKDCKLTTHTKQALLQSQFEALPYPQSYLSSDEKLVQRLSQHKPTFGLLQLYAKSLYFFAEHLGGDADVALTKLNELNKSYPYSYVKKYAENIAQIYHPEGLRFLTTEFSQNDSLSQLQNQLCISTAAIRCFLNEDLNLNHLFSAKRLETPKQKLICKLELNQPPVLAKWLAKNYLTSAEPTIQDFLPLKVITDDFCSTETYLRKKTKLHNHRWITVALRNIIQQNSSKNNFSREASL